MKVERTKKEHGRHNSGGIGRVVVATTSLDDESSQSYNSNRRKLG